ncbi:hypothetical protein RchiOBHm_Chr1g0331451 [Rosa chinensis]|uniref:Nodulin-like domain-containing protein n=1 Tax=Rosa chinensis TaxID=74649 RepID=A0A2P6SBJ4_ROSCH|nr:hypothetical protein RchiOBHm_Chr1g0331451 [Rosa chinensis]
MWGLLTIGAVLNFLGCGLLWLIVSQKIAALPLWVCLASHLSKEIYEGCRGCESKGKLLYCLLILLSSKQGRSCCMTLDCKTSSL